MRLHNLQLTVIVGKEFFDVFSGLIVHNIQFRFESFICQFLEVLFVSVIYTDIIQSGDWCCEYGILFIMIQDEEANAAIEGHEWEQSCEVMIYDPTGFISKCTKTENVCR